VLRLTWWLIIIILQALPNGQYPAQKLQDYGTYEECAPEADRVMKEMQKAYPGDKTYTIVCWNSTEKQA
jgi:hypothetical protein